MEQVKLRVLKSKQSNSTQVIGFTLPPSFTTFHELGTFYNVSTSGDSIVFTSGTKISEIKQLINEVDLEDFKI